MARDKGRRLPGLAALMEDRVQRVVAARVGVDRCFLNRVARLRAGASRGLTRRLAAYFGVGEGVLTGEQTLPGPDGDAGLTRQDLMAHRAENTPETSG